jgi:predicted transcriptional regulator
MTTRSTRRAAEQELIDAAIGFVHTPLPRVSLRSEIRLREAALAYEELGLDRSSQPATSNNTTDTSNLAAASMNRHVGKLAKECYDEIYATFLEGAVGLTVDAIEQRLNRSHQSVSARVNELRNKGWLVDSGITRLTRSGRPAIVWRPSTAARLQGGR